MLWRARAEAVQQLRQHGVAVVFVHGLAGQQGGGPVFQRRRPGVPVMQFAGQFRHFPVLALFLDEGVQARVTVRVQQPQAREVALHAQLFRRGGEQQQAGAGARQPLDALIGL